MSFKVAKAFRDGEDELHLYKIKAVYPRKGFNPTQERIDFLVSKGFITEDKHKKKEG
ncbi:hypothetical protein AB3329_07970 [Streptococcus sp. H31]|uniref:hypothetical protein n=1 Tax=Streptococcus huangxiaojuni TaxID=3237239 RepID=UPI0034A503F3